jgi:hypothetical protein
VEFGAPQVLILWSHLKRICTGLSILLALVVAAALEWQESMAAAVVAAVLVVVFPVAGVAAVAELGALVL